MSEEQEYESSWDREERLKREADARNSARIWAEESRQTATGDAMSPELIEAIEDFGQRTRRASSCLNIAVALMTESVLTFPRGETMVTTQMEPKQAVALAAQLQLEVERLYGPGCVDAYNKIKEIQRRKKA